VKKHKRARSTEQKSERREAIIASALKLFESKTFQQISVADIARRAGIGKGTFFLYYKTKEELFFSVIRTEFQTWLDAMDAMFSEKRNVTKEGLLALFNEVLGNRSLLAKLITIQYTVLENNVAYADILDFKRMMIERLTRTGRLIEESSSVVPPGQGFRLIMWMYAMVIGLFQMASPSQKLARIYTQEPGMTKFLMNFKEEYFEMLRAILSGWENAQAKHLRKG